MSIYYFTVVLSLVIGAAGYYTIYYGMERHSARYSRLFYPHTGFKKRYLYAITSGSLFYFGINCLILYTVYNG